MIRERFEEVVVFDGFVDEQERIGVGQVFVVCDEFDGVFAANEAVADHPFVGEEFAHVVGDGVGQDHHTSWG